VALLLIVTLWASYPAATKLALEAFPPFFLAATRCALASTFLVALLARSGVDAVRGLTPGAWRPFLILGVTGIWGSTQFTYLAIYHTTASNAVILQAAAPVVVALGARLYLGERLAWLGWMGVGASAFGVLLVITDGRLLALRPEDLRLGDFLTLLCLIGWSAYTVYGKRVLVDASPVLATTAAYVLGTVLILPTAFLAAPFFPPPRWGAATAWLVVAYQGIVGAVAHVWWYRAVHVVGPSRSAIFMNVQPVVGVLLAALLLGERVGVWDVAGGALVLVGVALTTRARTR
jgi:drug/metabolite transporter (DMT)-like permease